MPFLTLKEHQNYIYLRGSASKIIKPTLVTPMPLYTSPLELLRPKQAYCTPYNHPLIFTELMVFWGTIRAIKVVHPLPKFKIH